MSSKTQHTERTKSIDAKLKQRWQQHIQRERAYEREKGEKSKQDNDSTTSSLIEVSFVGPNNRYLSSHLRFLTTMQYTCSSHQLTRDLLVPWAQNTSSEKVAAAPVLEMEPSDDADEEPKKMNDLCNSIVEMEDPPAMVTPEDKAKEIHKVLAKLDTSGEKQVYSPQEHEYYNFHKQLYAPPQEQEYLKFLQDLEQASEHGDPTAQQKEFAEWLKDVDKDLQPIAPPQHSPEMIKEEKSPKKVAFSKENTVRFFSRTREELMQLKRKYKKTIRRGDINDEDNSDEEDWPLFKFLDEKLKELEELDAWNDPMAAVTDMFVPKEVKQTISPMFCVCEDEPAATDGDQACDNAANRSLADLDDEVLGPAMEVATSKAAAAITIQAEKEQSFQSQDLNTPEKLNTSDNSNASKNSGISALWFAVPYKSHSTPETSESFIRPVASPANSSGSDKLVNPKGKDKSADSARLSGMEAPRNLSLISSKASEEPETTGKALPAADPDAPKTTSLSWLAEELNGSHNSRDTNASLLSANSLNDSALSNDKNTSISSLGRDTHSNLLQRVSEHLHDSSVPAEQDLSWSSDEEDDDSAVSLSEAAPPIITSSASARSPIQVRESSLKNLLDHPAPSNGRSCPTSFSHDHKDNETVSTDRRDISASLEELDDLAMHYADKTVSVSMLPDGQSETTIQAKGTSSNLKEIPYDKKKQVVDAAKRWAEAQKSGDSHYTLAVASRVASVQKTRHCVQKSKQWAAIQRAISQTPAIAETARDVSPTPEDGPDLDESRDWKGERNTSAELNESLVSEVWEGVGLSPRTPHSDLWDKIEEGPDFDESKEENKEPEQEFVFDHTAARTSAKDDVACINSNPWLSAEDGPDLDESKEWNAFERPDITTTTGSMSHDSPSLDESDEWVAFASDRMKAPKLDERPWRATFPEDEKPRPQADAPMKSPKKQVRPKEQAPSIQAQSSRSRVRELASKFERRDPKPPEDWGMISPLTASPTTPSKPWADDRKNENSAEFPDLQQPVLDCESRSGSNQSSPVSVTLI